MSAPIRRRFKDIEPGKLVELEQGSILETFGLQDGIGWDELLQSPRVVVIAEAGAGKTFECRERQRTLWDAGEPAFLIDLSQFAAAALEDLLTPDEYDRFEQWRDGAGRATFFLDSVDELQLTPTKFRTALLKLQRALGSALARAGIVATARPTAHDLDLMRTALPLPPAPAPPVDPASAARVLQHGEPAEEPGAPPFCCVALLPLTDAQMRDFIGLRGLPDPDALILDLRRRNQEDEARRPQDLLDHIAAWTQEGPARSLRQRKERSVAMKLRPREDRAERVDLSAERALDGARRLALAVMLTRRLTIRHSLHGDDGPPDEAAVDPERVLTGWSRAEVLTLLERGLFAPASYGRVRFHHRSAAEHLAAERLRARIDGGLALGKVKRLLFARTAQGLPVVRPGLRAVTAWLAGVNDGVFHEVLRREPELLMVEGDPESLTAERRVAVVGAVIDRHGRGGWRGLRAPEAQLARIATPALEPVIAARWAGIGNGEVKELLLAIIGGGKLAGCSGLAFDAAMDAGEEYPVRVDALRALASLEDARLADVAQSVEEEPARWRDKIGRYAVALLFPRFMDAARLCRIVMRMQEPRNALGVFNYHLPELIDDAAIPLDELATLREGLHGLVADGMTANEGGHVVQTPRPWLVPALTSGCLREWRDAGPAPTLMASVALANRLHDGLHSDRERREALRALVADAPAEAREALFMADAALLESLHPEREADGRAWRVEHDGLMRLSDDKDGAWLRAALADAERDEDERAFLLFSLLRCTRHEENVADRAEALRPLVADVPRLAEEVDKLVALLRAPRVEHEPDRRWRQQSRAREEAEQRAQAELETLTRRIAEETEEAFTDRWRERTLEWLCHAMERADGHNSGWHRASIEKLFGSDVADRLAADLTSFWRERLPPLPSERQDREDWQQRLHWRWGLAGLGAEAEKDDWARRLSADEARLACRYATFNLNGHPAWLDDLARAHPDAVAEVIGGELAAELALRPGEHGGMELQDASGASEPVAPLLLPPVRGWLRSVTLPNAVDAGWETRIRRAGRLLLRAGDADDRMRVRDMAVAALGEGLDAPGAAGWLDLLFRADAGAAMDVFERGMAALPVEKEGRAVQLVAAATLDRYGEPLAELPTLAPDQLLRLARIAYAHVRPADDNRREGSFTPQTRDHAERGRGVVVDALLAAPGAEGWAAKQALADDPLAAHMRDHLRRAAEQRAAREVDAPLTPEDALDFERQGEAPPRTPGAMFALLLDRLEEVGDQLCGDASPREEWARLTQERELRRRIAGVLDGRACGLYLVDQEAVTGDEKETDIRLHARVGEQEGVIELKVGENGYSLRDLREALRDQLLGRYLLPSHRRAGVLLVTLAADRLWKADGRTLDFSEVITLLNAEARELAGTRMNEVHLAVRGLDLRPGPRSRLVGG